MPLSHRCSFGVWFWGENLFLCPKLCSDIAFGFVAETKTVKIVCITWRVVAGEFWVVAEWFHSPRGKIYKKGGGISMQIEHAEMVNGAIIFPIFKLNLCQKLTPILVFDVWKGILASLLFSWGVKVIIFLIWCIFGYS